MRIKRMLRQVANALVVITNPTGIAIAIGLQPETMDNPRCVAKGSGRIAKKILEVAREHDVPIVQVPYLARELNKNVKLGGYIPSIFYDTVAEVIAFVRRMKTLPF